MTLTVWTNQAGNVRLHQLSSDPEDGTVIDQVAYLVTLDAFSGWSCVSTGYQGSVPDADPSLWRWGDQGITAVLPVPASITPRQTRLLLLQQGLLSQVETMMQSQPEAAQIAWNYALEFKRDDPLLNQLAIALGLTEAQLDDFFRAASTL